MSGVSSTIDDVGELQFIWPQGNLSLLEYWAKRDQLQEESGYFTQRIAVIYLQRPNYGSGLFHWVFRYERDRPIKPRPKLQQLVFKFKSNYV